MNTANTSNTTVFQMYGADFKNHFHFMRKSMSLSDGRLKKSKFDFNFL
jgi:hypothetical protein